MLRVVQKAILSSINPTKRTHMGKARDNLPTTNAGDAVQAAYQALSSLQNFTPAQQVAGVAILLKEIAEQINVSPSELLDKAARMTTDADTFFTREVKALRAYIQGELR